MRDVALIRLLARWARTLPFLVYVHVSGVFVRSCQQDSCLFSGVAKCTLCP